MDRLWTRLLHRTRTPSSRESGDTVRGAHADGGRRAAHVVSMLLSAAGVAEWLSSGRPGFVATTAVVHRFVDVADPGSRGYDISITSRIAGLRDDEQVMFAIVDEPIPDIELGAKSWWSDAAMVPVDRAIRRHV